MNTCRQLNSNRVLINLLISCFVLIWSSKEYVLIAHIALKDKQIQRMPLIYVTNGHNGPSSPYTHMYYYANVEKDACELDPHKTAPLHPLPHSYQGCFRTRVRTAVWSTGSNALCCLICSFCSVRSHLWSTAQTAGRCSLWWASNCKHTDEHTLFRRSELNTRTEPLWL